MPIYEFECQKCHHQFEALLPSSTSQFPSCEDCNSKKVDKLISLFAFSTGADDSGFAGSSSSSSCSSCTASSCAGCH